MKKKILEIKDLKISFSLNDKKGYAVDGLNLDLYEGEIVGLVGESGSGKSVTAYSVLGLISEPPGKIESGEIIYKGTDLLKLSFEELRKFRGSEIAMIFQEPGSALNPVMTVESQLAEVFNAREKTDGKEIFEKSVELLRQVGIPDAVKRIKEYPGSLSGGMQQRVMIAMALAGNPSLLIADEPTTSLDVTVQAAILDLMLKLKKQNRISSIVLITHNLGVVAGTCDSVAVMYGGKIQESSSTKEIFLNPLHPYTKLLLESVPVFGKQAKEDLKSIPGSVHGIYDNPPGCKFYGRCPAQKTECGVTEPPLKEIKEGHFVRCFLYE